MVSKNFESVKNEIFAFLTNDKNVKDLKESHKFAYRHPQFMTNENSTCLIDRTIEFKKSGIEITFGFIIDYSVGVNAMGQENLRMHITISKGVNENAVFIFDLSDESDFVLKLLQIYKPTYISPDIFSFIGKSSHVEFVKYVHEKDLPRIQSQGKQLWDERENREWEMGWEGALKEYEFSVNGESIKVQARSIEEAKNLVDPIAEYVNASVIEENAEYKDVKQVDWEVEDDPINA